VKVRIRVKPHEHEVDGVKLDSLIPGAVRDVSAALGSWLIASGYADLEMRSDGARPRDPLERDNISQLPQAADRRRNRRQS